MVVYPRIWIDIDTQRDFIEPSGALYVPGAEHIVPNLHSLMQAAARAAVPVLSSADDHPKGDPEFADFPPHCLRGTRGQEKLPETLLERRITIEPGSQVSNWRNVLESNDQIIFTKTTFSLWSNPAATGLLEHVDITQFIVFGVATEYCVRDSVLGLLKRDRRVVVVEDAIRPVSEETGQRALEEMTGAGATLARTADIIGELA